ncbi:MAG: T9SS type A sorting domain-containing protein [Bacteroidota bacterium]
MKKLTVWMLAMVLTVPVLAQQGPHKIDKEKRKQVRQQIRAYAEQNIIPVVIENRMDFEDILTEDEKTKIADLRERQQELKSQAKAHRQTMRGQRQQGLDQQLTEEERNQRRLVRKEMRLITTATYEIIDEHEDFFLAMESDLADERETWRKEMKAITEAARGSSGKNNGQERAHRRGRGGKHHRKGGGHGMHGMRDMLAPVAFVLLDPMNPPTPGDDLQPIEIFPNPTSAKQSINVNLRQSGPVKVELVDAEGKLLDVLYEKSLNEGSNQIEVDLSRYKGNQYFYKITTPDGTETKRVLKNSQ